MFNLIWQNVFLVFFFMGEGKCYFNCVVIFMNCFKGIYVLGLLKFFEIKLMFENFIYNDYELGFI